MDKNHCYFWTHKWTTWEQFERTMFHTKFSLRIGDTFQQVFQRRFCTKCNKEQVKKIRH